MKNIDVTEFEKEMEKYAKMVIKDKKRITVNTKEGKMVVIPEEEYRGLIETLYIESIPGLKDEIIARANSPEEDFISEEEVEW